LDTDAGILRLPAQVNLSVSRNQMSKLRYFLGIIVVIVVGLFGALAAYGVLWQLSPYFGLPFADHDNIAGIFLVATLIGMAWFGFKLASFNEWPLCGKPSLEQLSKLDRLHSVVLTASRAIEVTSTKVQGMGYVLEVGKGKVIFVEVSVFDLRATYVEGEEDLSARVRLFPSSKFEIHFDTKDGKIMRIDCLGDNLEIEECFPVIKKRRAFETKYPQGRLINVDWDQMIEDMRQLTSKSMRRP